MHVNAFPDGIAGTLHYVGVGMCQATRLSICGIAMAPLRPPPRRVSMVLSQRATTSSLSSKCSVSRSSDETFVSLGVVNSRVAVVVRLAMRD
jgi:hypothetical protein